MYDSKNSLFDTSIDIFRLYGIGKNDPAFGIIESPTITCKNKHWYVIKLIY